ncbi:MAG: GNAT family N-acetyltransferase [Dehalococcoidia bacterium]
MIVPQPVTLAGRLVELQPFVPEHAAGLFEAAQDDEVWTYIPWSKPQSVAEMEAFVEESRARMAAGTEIPFAIVELESGKPVGQIGYIDIAPADGHIEIGTWLAREVWRSGINTECKYLLLRHAFETLGAMRVQMKTDVRNERSQRAIERLGAVREALFRKSQIIKDGHVRSSIVYSIVDDEWPAVKANLESKLGLVETA